jgi:hypothetical protein
MQQFSDQELVSGVLQGSSAHQSALYRQYSVPMFRVLLRFARDKAEAEDMMQDGFVRVFRDMGQFRGDGALAWMDSADHGEHRLEPLAETAGFCQRCAGFFGCLKRSFTQTEDFASNLDAQTLAGLFAETAPQAIAQFSIYMRSTGLATRKLRSSWASPSVPARANSSKPGNTSKRSWTNLSYHT